VEAVLYVLIFEMNSASQVAMCLWCSRVFGLSTCHSLFPIFPSLWSGCVILRIASIRFRHGWFSGVFVFGGHRIICAIDSMHSTAKNYFFNIISSTFHLTCVFMSSLVLAVFISFDPFFLISLSRRDETRLLWVWEIMCHTFVNSLSFTIRV
jgi:hypothetical protein